MTWYAASAIDDAFDATRRFLFPFEGWRWLKLAIIAFFLGGAGGGLNLPSGAGNVGVPPGGGDGTGGPGGDGVGPGSGFGDVGGIEPGPVDPGTFPGGVEVAIILGIVAIVLALVLAFGIVGAVMEFVLLDALRTNDVRLRRYFRRRLGKGLRLFVFRLVLGFGLALVIAALVVAAIVLTDGQGNAVLGTLAVGIPLVVALGAIVAVVAGLTTEFVAPVMIVDDVGVLAGWRQFWPTFAGHWKQYGLYLVVRLILAIAVGIAATLATAVVVIAIAILFGIVGALAAFGFGGPEALVSTNAGLALVAVLGFGFVVCAIATVLVIRVPVVTYFRCYALTVLGDSEPTFDLLGSLREEGGTG